METLLEFGSLNKKGLVKRGFMAVVFVAVMLGILFSLSSGANPVQYQIIGDSAQWENEYGSVKITPHTILSPSGEWQVELTSLVPTQAIDCAFVAPQDAFEFNTIEYYGNKQKMVPSEDYMQYWDNDTSSWKTSTNKQPNGSFHYETAQDWIDIKDKFSKTFCLAGKTCYQISIGSWPQGSLKKLKVQADVAPDSTEEVQETPWFTRVIHRRSNIKFDFACKRASDTWAYAYASGLMFLVDPFAVWNQSSGSWNGSYSNTQNDGVNITLASYWDSELYDSINTTLPSYSYRSAGWRNGMIIVSKIEGNISTVKTTIDYPIMEIRDTEYNVLASTSTSSNVATFNYPLTKDTTYIIVAGSDGGMWDMYYKYPCTPMMSGTNINYTKQVQLVEGVWSNGTMACETILNITSIAHNINKIGNFTSTSYCPNLTNKYNWSQIEYGSSAPPGTGLSLQARFSNDNLAWNNWSGNYSSGQTGLNNSAACMQWKATLNSDGTETSYLSSVNVNIELIVPPSTPNPSFDIATAYTDTPLNCSVSNYISYPEGDNMDVFFNLTVNGTLKEEYIVLNQANGSQPSWIIDSGNYSKGDEVKCYIKLFDGLSYSESNYTSINISNSEPVVESYNASSATYTDILPNVNFSEGENITFVVEASDADSDTLSYLWLLDDSIQNWTLSWFSHLWDYLTAGLHIVSVNVSDTDNAITNHLWNVNIANVVNKQWSVDFVEPPTPYDKENLTSQSVNISVLVAPSVVKEATVETFTDSSEADFDNGTYENTNYSLSKLALVLNRTGLFEDFFNESFESGLGSWVVTGAGTLWNAQSGSSRTGAYHAEANNTGVGSTTYMYSNISTLGYVGINVTYYRQLVNLGSNDVFAAEWYNGTGWADLERVIIGGNDADYVARSFNLTLAADGNPAFRLRFACQNGQATEKCRLDDVAVSGTTLIYVAKGNFTSRVFNASEEAVWETINWSSDVGSGSSLKFKVKSCANADCSDASFTGDYYTSPGSLIVNNNQYVQYKAFFETTNSSVTPELFNVAISGHTIEEVEDVAVSSAWIEWNGVNKGMSGSGLSWSYANNTLDKGGYTYRVYVNDSFGNVNMTTQRIFNVPSYEIMFNVTNGDTGVGLDNINITCDYNGFNQNDTSNMYGTYTFPVGNWVCTFKDSINNQYYDKTTIFSAYNSQTISVIMEFKKQLTNQEHDWLRELYECILGGDCNLYKWVNGTYMNVSRIWNEYIPTNISVVADETFINKTLSATSNITINYTVHVPYKKGVEDKALLPIRIFYWFTNSNGTCYNQDKQADSNRAETPFCIPLIAEFLGPNNGTTSFIVVLKPNLSYGTYEVVRQIDIDPPVNGVQTWINYGREKIGSITVDNLVKAAPNLDTESASPAVVEAKLPALPESGLNQITGASVVVSDSKIKTIGLFIVIGLAIICASVTIISTIYIRSRYK